MNKGETYCAEVYLKDNVLVYSDYVVYLSSEGGNKRKSNTRPRKVDTNSRELVSNIWDITGMKDSGDPRLAMSLTHEGKIMWAISPDRQIWSTILELDKEDY